MSYIRVLPRDLFNEANLLKCVGALWIKLENHPNAKFDQEDVDAFDIRQSDDDGSLSIVNISLTIHGRRYRFRRPLNSRASWPLYIREDGEWDDVPVFTDGGDLSPEIRELIT
jgi:hypothetical protein